MFDRKDIIAGVPLRCSSCEFDLTALVRPQPAPCNHNGLMCAYPCGKARKRVPDGGYQPCPDNIPHIPL